jgi:hypothetical protein
MSYTHNKGYSSTADGFAVGAKGAEVQAISQTGQLYQQGTALTSSAAELNTLTGITASVTELNLVDGAQRLRKIAKVALAATADTGGAILSWVNPEASAIIITRLVLDITTKATSACTVDFGTTASSATTLSDTLIDGLDINAAIGTFDNITDKGTNGKSRLKLASGKWVTGSTASGAVAGTVGFAYIEYFVI